MEMANNKGAGKTAQRRINRFDQIIVCNSCWLFASFCLSSKIKVIMVTMFGLRGVIKKFSAQNALVRFIEIKYLSVFHLI